MVDLHRTVATALLLLMVLLGLWGLFLGLINRGVSGAYRSTYVLSIGVFGLQAVLGAALLISGRRPQDTLHYIYGIVPFLSLGGGLTFGRDLKPRSEALALGVAALFTFGIIIRSFTTGTT